MILHSDGNYILYSLDTAKGVIYNRLMFRTQEMEMTEQKTKQLTDSELAMLKKIRDCEYHDGREPIGDNVWLNVIATSMADGGVLTSLQKKGLVQVTIYSPVSNDNVVCLTYAGATYLMLEGV